MGSAVRKRGAASDLPPLFDKPVIAVIPPDDDEPTLDELLGPEPEKKTTRATKSDTKLRTPKTPRARKGEMVTFLTKKGKRVTAQATTYYVVRHEGKLHYKKTEDCIILPDDWKEGDPIPSE